MKVMISMPMNGRRNDDIINRLNELRQEFAKLHIDVIDSFIKTEAGELNHPGVFYIAKSIMLMADIDAVYFDDGWIDSRGCRIEHVVCQEYGIRILDSKFLFGNQPRSVIPKPLSKQEQICALKAILKDNPQLKDEIEPQIEELENELQIKHQFGSNEIKIMPCKSEIDNCGINVTNTATRQFDKIDTDTYKHIPRIDGLEDQDENNI